MTTTLTRARLLASGLLGGGVLLGADLSKAVEVAQAPVAEIVDQIPVAKHIALATPGHWAPSGLTPNRVPISALTWYDAHGIEQVWRSAGSDAERRAIEQLILMHGGEYVYGGEPVGLPWHRFDKVQE